MPDTKSNQKTALSNVSVRFCGDSGDGMQLTGSHFTDTVALAGNDFATAPDFPAEIRAPKGTTFGVSGYQIQFSSQEIHTPGDLVNAMVAMNPAGFKTNLEYVETGGIVIVNDDEFNKSNFKKCGYEEGYNPLDDEVINAKYKICRVPMSRLTRESLVSEDSDVSVKDIDRCRNMFALGIISWLYSREIDSTIDKLQNYFGKLKNKPEIAELNEKAIKAGYYFGETAEFFPSQYEVSPAKLQAGEYRRISGNEAIVLGLATAATKVAKPLVYASYPITPASDVLHGLARLKQFGIRTMQAEDEIAAVMVAIGASFAGQIGVTGTSGPGLALKSEAIGLAVMMELPLIVVNVQRAGPATGMPTKTEQSDLLQAMFGRPGECPVIVVAASSPGNCFHMAIEAARLSLRAMCPVVFLSEGGLGNAAEPWLIPDIATIPNIEVKHAEATDEEFLPYKRDEETGGRPWAIPGMPGLEHRVGGLEKQDGTGGVSYDHENHALMTKYRAEKIAKLQNVIPDLEVEGEGDTLILGWGGTRGSILAAATLLHERGISVATAHLHYINPFPKNIGDVLSKYKKVIMPEMNSGQLRMLLRSQFLVDIEGIQNLCGRSFFVEELADQIQAMLKGGVK
ncbi:MAG: 2-oxoglutarate ferredoxin oxidoreductase subunit alpha [Phycisphaerae bacterium]|nr:2-oxoglutarate ferredoxin oxidoreductase subunit alpha [Phycisphaerae bacterium]|tara:strand:- start:4135 stop:6009 length:1875 start_codon:yes stop_codon:yes gene_type:complete